MDINDVTRITFPGDPISKARPRFGRNGRAYTPKRTSDEEKRLKALAIEAGVPCRDYPIAVTLKFYCATLRRTDATNLIKLVEDSLNGIAWTDDYLIESINARVFRRIEGEEPRTELLIEPL